MTHKKSHAINRMQPKAALSERAQKMRAFQNTAWALFRTVNLDERLQLARSVWKHSIVDVRGHQYEYESASHERSPPGLS